VYLKLKQVKTQNIVAARSLADSTVGVVYIIVIDANGTIDTLREIPITDWSSVVGPKYIVQRNVDVTLPAKYDGDTVRLGYYNIYTNPSNYYSTVLGRYHEKQYSGFIYSAYDSASFAGNGYLYSALAIVKNTHDSIVAFTTDLDTVTAKVGNFSFDSTRFGAGILSVSQDTLIIPWYAFNVVNGTSVTAYMSVVKVKDSTVVLDTLLVDSALTGHVWNTGDGSITNILDSAHFINPGYKTIGADTLNMDVVSAYAVIEVDTAFDSLALTYYGYRAPYAYDGVKVYNTKHFQVGTDTANFDHIVALRAEPASRQSTSLFLNDVNYQVTKFSLSRFYLVRRGVAVYYK
jgi:hypothetical protein